MTPTLLVNLHCHSIFSDGELSPEALAEFLSANGVRYAALTDHDTIEGQQRFHSALKKAGMDFIPGVELTTFLDEYEIHLLGYGFKIEDTDLNNTLLSIRQTKSLDTVSIAASLRNRSAKHINPNKINHQNTIPSGKLETAVGIKLIHQAGGCVFLAHPMTLEKDQNKLFEIIKKLKTLGLDGIEAVYVDHSESEEQMLTEFANENNLQICAGTDLHTKFQKPSISMKREDWVNLRSMIFSSKGFFEISSTNAREESKKQFARNDPGKHAHHFQKRAYILRIFLPTFIAIALFLSAIWIFVLPSFENTLLDRKREMIRELTNSAISILNSYYQDELSGSLTHSEAQAMAIDRVQALRYGNESKDYFWIQNTYPTMIMHPYRPELNGEDLLDFKDARGVRIFVEFSNLVQREGEGYIEYVWQWKDDPERLEPKESFVKIFTPWDWIIGTGIYIDDVNEEIKKIERDITNTSVIVSAIIILLLLYVLQQSLRIEKDRQEVLDDFRESTERYHAVVKSITEGTLLVLGNRCRYANPTLISMIGYSEDQLPFLDLDDVLPKCKENQSIWDTVSQTDPQNFNTESAVDGYLKHKDGRFVDCILMLTPILYANQKGFILLARDITRQPITQNQEGLSKVANNVNLGIFKAKPVRRGVFLELNPVGYTFLPEDYKDLGIQPALADLFQNSGDFNQFIEELHHKGQIKDRLLLQPVTGKESLILSLSANLSRDESGEPESIIGIIEDVTKLQRQIAEREALIEKLQSSLLFFHEPLSKFERSLTICNMNTTILQVSRQLCDHNTSAALISADNNALIGIITDHDLRSRVLARNLDTSQPAYTIMTSPVVKIKERAMIYEAMIKMEEKNVRHMAVEDENGQIVNLVDTKMLAQFPRYGAYILLREIAQALTFEDLSKTNSRKNKVVKSLLDSSRNVKQVTQALSSIHDSFTERLLQLTIEELGQPPVPFAFICMGSQGRQEPTLIADQDNGIIFSGNNDFQPYFLELGEKVSIGLNAIGIKFCDGKVMASNPNWCKSIDAWKKDFNRWVTIPEPKELLDLSIFFDFRLVFGDGNLVQDLRNHVNLSLQDRNDFFYQYAQHTQKIKPPSRGIGGMLLGFGGSETSEREVNLKEVLMPIVSFARLYALKNNLPQIHTLDRLENLADRGLLTSTSMDDLSSAYEFLMQMRLKNQISLIEKGEIPENSIQISKIGELQKIRLREIYSQTNALQKRISYDFLGGMQ